MFLDRSQIVINKFTKIFILFTAEGFTKMKEIYVCLSSQVHELASLTPYF